MENDETVGTMKPTGADPLLSICIATFNRAQLIIQLVQDLLREPGAFEVCVHVDGATDSTMTLLSSINDARLRVSYGSNQGRAGALYSAVEKSRGRFVMLWDDDDQLNAEGLEAVLADCGSPLPDTCVGYIYHLADADDHFVGTRFPVQRSNFLSLRADMLVRGDKKEVVQGAALRMAMSKFGRNYRRIPTSLYWSHLALEFDVICRDIAIGRKNYLSGGMSDTIRSLKLKNSWPLVMLYATHLKGFLRRRYRSPRFALRAAGALVMHAAVGMWASLKAGRAGI